MLPKPRRQTNRNRHEVEKDCSSDEKMDTSEDPVTLVRKHARIEMTNSNSSTEIESQLKKIRLNRGNGTSTIIHSDPFEECVSRKRPIEISPQQFKAVSFPVSILFSLIKLFKGHSTFM